MSSEDSFRPTLVSASPKSTDDASDMADGIDGLLIDIDTAEPKSEELDARAGGKWSAVPLGLRTSSGVAGVDAPVRDGTCDSCRTFT